MSERYEYSETCRAIGMAGPWELLRGYGYWMEESSISSNPVISAGVCYVFDL